MVFNATFNNISVILWRLVLLVEETGVPGENQINVLRYNCELKVCPHITVSKGDISLRPTCLGPLLYFLPKTFTFQSFDLQCT
jgi:hypothetical protein